MNTQFDIYRKRIFIFRLVMIIITAMIGSAMIVWGILLTRCLAGLITYFPLKIYVIAVSILGGAFLISLILLLFSLRMFAGRYLLESHILTVYSGLFIQRAWFDEELKHDQFCPCKPYQITLKSGSVVKVKCSLVNRVKVYYKDEVLKTTNRY